MCVFSIPRQTRSKKREKMNPSKGKEINQPKILVMTFVTTSHQSNLYNQSKQPQHKLNHNQIIPYLYLSVSMIHPGSPCCWIYSQASTLGRNNIQCDRISGHNLSLLQYQKLRIPINILIKEQLLGPSPVHPRC